MDDQLKATSIPVIKIIGLGGGGSNAINRMIELGITGVDFIAANTDHQVLETCHAPQKIQLGPTLTRGLGAGGNPEIGLAAAEESQREIKAALSGGDLVFLTAGMGGGTGTGAISVAARIARELGAVTVAIVTTPFSFEMRRRSKSAQWGLDQLKPHCDTLITVPNDKLLSAAAANLPLDIAFRLADDLLRQGIQGITELITCPGIINVSYNHLLNQFKSGGGSVLTIGRASGTNKALNAVRQALSHPMLDEISLDHASSIIANFTGGNEMTFLEVAEALTYLHDHTPLETEVIPGVMNRDDLGDEVEVILVVTGIGGEPVTLVSTPAADNIASVNMANILMAEASTFSEKRLQTQQPVPGNVKAQYNPTAANNLDIPAFLRRKVG